MCRTQLGVKEPYLIPKEEADRMWVRPQNPVRGHSLWLGEEPKLTVKGYSRRTLRVGNWRGRMGREDTGP